MKVILTRVRGKHGRGARGKTDVDSAIHSDSWRVYNGFVDFDYKKHFRVQHGKNEFVRGNSHINGIESFWGYAKNRLVKFKEMDKKKMFNLHLKECEFRFNNRLSCHDPKIIV
jgi:transposase